MLAESLSTSQEFRSAVINVSQLAADGHTASTRMSSRRRSVNDEAVDLIFAPDEYDAVARYTAIQQRLVQLEHALFEESRTRIHEDSRREFMRSISSNPSVRRPSVSADPNGRLTATWRRADGQELTMRFDGRGVTHFSLLVRSRASPRGFEQRWGTAHDPAALFAIDPLVRQIAT